MVRLADWFITKIVTTRMSFLKHFIRYYQTPNLLCVGRKGKHWAFQIRNYKKVKINKKKRYKIIKLKSIGKWKIERLEWQL